MRRGCLFACSLLLLGGLAACSGPAVYMYDYDVAYSRGEVLFASTSKPLRVEAFGQLKPGPALEEGALASAVAHGPRRSGPQWFRARYTAQGPRPCGEKEAP